MTDISPRDLPAIADIAQLDWNITLRRQIGEVIAAQRTQSMQVTSTTRGGGGSVYNGTGRIDPVETNTNVSTTDHDTVFIRQNDGVEQRLTFTNAPDIWREGSLLSIDYAVRDGREQMVRLRNLDTGEALDWTDHAVQLLTTGERYEYGKDQIKRYLMIWLFIALLVAAFVAGWVGFLFGLIATCVIFSSGLSMAGKKLEADLAAY